MYQLEICHFDCGFSALKSIPSGAGDSQGFPCSETATGHDSCYGLSGEGRGGGGGGGVGWGGGVGGEGVLLLLWCFNPFGASSSGMQQLLAPAAFSDSGTKHIVTVFKPP